MWKKILIWTLGNALNNILLLTFNKYQSVVFEPFSAIICTADLADDYDEESGMSFFVKLDFF